MKVLVVVRRRAAHRHRYRRILVLAVVLASGWDRLVFLRLRRRGGIRLRRLRLLLVGGLFRLILRLRLCRLPSLPLPLVAHRAVDVFVSGHRRAVRGVGSRAKRADLVLEIHDLLLLVDHHRGGLLVDLLLLLVKLVLPLVGVLLLVNRRTVDLRLRLLDVLDGGRLRVERAGARRGGHGGGRGRPAEQKDKGSACGEHRSTMRFSLCWKTDFSIRREIKFPARPLGDLTD